jgi:hypothetical protein
VNVCSLVFFPEMAQTMMALEVASSDIIAKIVDNEGVSSLSMGLSFKLPIAELLQALASCQAMQKQLTPSQAVKPKVEAAPPVAMQQPMQPGLVASVPQSTIPPGPPSSASPTAPSPPASTPSEELAKDAPSASSVATAPPPDQPSSSVTWTTPLDKLQPIREEYTSKSRWEPSSNKWELLEEASLSTVTIQRFEKQPLAKKAPTLEDPQAPKKAEQAFELLKKSLAGPPDSAEARKSEDGKNKEEFPPLSAVVPPSIPPPPAPGSSKEPYEAKAAPRAGNPTDAPEVTGAEPQGARPDVPPMPPGPPPAPPSGQQDTSPTQSQKPATPGGKAEGGKECKQQ